MFSLFKSKLRHINRPFLLILGLQVLLYLFLIAQNRIPGGHDGFSAFYQRYYFMNSAVTAGEIPLWIPYMTHGTLAAWMFYVQSGLCQNFWLLLGLVAGPVLKFINFIPLYLIGIFFEELMLLTGTWLLARRLFPSRWTAFIITVTVMGSDIWMLQPGFNLYLYYCVPLIFYFFHRFLDTGRWRWFFLSGNLAAVQYLGTAPYFLAVFSLAACVYFGTYLIFSRDVRQHFFKRVKLKPGTAAALLGVVITFAALYALIFIHGGDIITFDLGRTIHGETTLESFLTHGRNLGLKKWGELFLGVSPTVDMTVYISYLPLLLILMAFCVREGWRNKHILLTALTLLLFGFGGWFSVWLYHLWPMMKFYRHLGLIAPLIKLFLCLWAGCGAEGLLRIARDPAGQMRLRQFLVFAATCFVFTSLAVFLIARDHHLVTKLVSGLTERSMFIFNEMTGEPYFLSGLKALFDPELLPAQLLAAAGTALLVGVLGIGLALNSNKKRAAFLLALLTGVHVFSICDYKLFQTLKRTVRVTPFFQTVTRFQEIPFHSRREPDFVNDNPRSHFLKQLIAHNYYWSSYAFFFRDEIGHATRTDYWLKTFNDFMKAYWGQALDKEDEPVKGLAQNIRLSFPLTHSTAAQMGALSADKIQFFRRAFLMPGKERTAALMRHPEYKGGFLWLAPLTGETTENPATWSPEERISQDTRLNLDYRVTHFDTNNLNLNVTVPGGQPAWLFYSDIWHPVWKARVNGQPRPVYKANLAYKAVRLDPGKNAVHFFARDLQMQTLYAFWIFMSVFWMAGLLILTKKCLMAASEPTAEEVDP